MTSKFGDNCVTFFGQLNPFSNFHPAPFTLNGKNYPTIEHFIQEACAIHFNDKTSARRILSAKTLLEAKRIGNEIMGYKAEKWMSVAKELVKPGITAKFMSHPVLTNVLTATRGMTLAEATFDKFWGTGIPIHDVNSANHDKWHGIGILGEILMEIREEFDTISVMRNTPLDVMGTGTISLPEATDGNNVNQNSYT